jgi:hypothetical protein
MRITRPFVTTVKSTSYKLIAEYCILQQVYNLVRDYLGPFHAWS